MTNYETYRAEIGVVEEERQRVFYSSRKKRVGQSKHE